MRSSSTSSLRCAKAARACRPHLAPRGRSSRPRPPRGRHRACGRQESSHSAASRGLPYLGYQTCGSPATFRSSRVRSPPVSCHQALQATHVSNSTHAGHWPSYAWLPHIALHHCTARRLQDSVEEITKRGVSLGDGGEAYSGRRIETGSKSRPSRPTCSMYGFRAEPGPTSSHSSCPRFDKPIETFA